MLEKYFILATKYSYSKTCRNTFPGFWLRYHELPSWVQASVKNRLKFPWLLQIEPISIYVWTVLKLLINRAWKNLAFQPALGISSSQSVLVQASFSFLFKWFSWQMTCLISCSLGKWKWNVFCPEGNFKLTMRQHFFWALII